MLRGLRFPPPFPRACLPPVLLAIAVASALSPETAQADLVIAASNVNVNAGTTGNALDVTLTNTGPNAVGIGGFTFELTVATNTITLTDVTTSTTAPYIFGALSTFGPSIGIPVTGQDIMASDVDSIIGSGKTLAAGETVGLGHVVFNVSAGGSGSNTVTILAYPNSSLSSFSGANVPITTLTAGSINVRAVPEPSSLAMTFLGLAAASCLACRRNVRSI